MPKTQRLGGEEQKNVGAPFFFFFFSIYTNLLMFIFMDLLTHVYTCTYYKKNYIEKKVENSLKFFSYYFAYIHFWRSGSQNTT